LSGALVGSTILHATGSRNVAAISAIGTFFVGLAIEIFLPSVSPVVTAIYAVKTIYENVIRNRAIAQQNTQINANPIPAPPAFIPPPFPPPALSRFAAPAA
jgi:hypothetical protein